MRSRALVLESMMERSRIVHVESDPTLAALARELENARHRQASLLVRGANGLPADVRQRLESDADEATAAAARALAEASAAFAREHDTRSAELEVIADALPRNASLISLFRYDQVAPESARREARYFAFVLDSESREPQAVSLGSAAAIDEHVERWARDRLPGPCFRHRRGDLEPPSRGESAAQSMGPTGAVHEGRADLSRA